MNCDGFMSLDVWQKSHRLTLAVYQLTKLFPKEERYGLTAQMRTAAVSIPANIAEGYGRLRPNDKARFYNISQGSAQELKHYFILSRDLGYVADANTELELLEDVLRMLRRLIQATLRTN